MSKKSVPFTSVPNLSKGKLLLSDRLSFDLHRGDGELCMSVEATRLGADKRKITGWATMDQYQILRLWAGLDRLVKELGLTDQVQTEAEYAEERRVQNEATHDNFMKCRQRMALGKQLMTMSKKREALNEDQRAVALEIIDMHEDDFRARPVSTINEVSHRFLGYQFTVEERTPVGLHIAESIGESDQVFAKVKLSDLSLELQSLGRHFLSSYMDELTMVNVAESMHRIAGTVLGRTLSPTEEYAFLRFLRYRISSFPERAQKIQNYLETNDLISENNSDHDLKVYANQASIMLDIELSESEFEKLLTDTFKR